MDEKLIEKYKKELIEMSKRATLPAVAEVTDETPKGKLSVWVTTYKGLKGIENAEVSVFTGSIENRNVIDSDITNSSGRTKEFVLGTKPKNLSNSENQDKKPFSTYSIYVKADGFVEQAHLNIPIFEGVTSIQNVDLITFSANNDSDTPRIIDETPYYNL